MRAKAIFLTKAFVLGGLIVVLAFNIAGDLDNLSAQVLNPQDECDTGCHIHGTMEYNMARANGKSEKEALQIGAQEKSECLDLLC